MQVTVEVSNGHASLFDSQHEAPINHLAKLER